MSHARWTARGWLFTATVLSLIALMVVFVWTFVEAVRIPTTPSLPVASDAQVADLQNQINDLHHETDRLLGIVGAGFGVTVTLAVLVVAFNLVSSQWAKVPTD